MASRVYLSGVLSRRGRRGRDRRAVTLREWCPGRSPCRAPLHYCAPISAYVHIPPSAMGAALRAARKERGLSQTALGARAGKHPTYISGIERGERNPSLAALASL